jgi:sec-independent protein translocase protein TatC
MPEPAAMTFWDHLDELRKRLLRSIAAIAVLATAGYFVADRALAYLVKPFYDQVKGSLALLAPGDGFIIQVKVGILIGMMVAIPYVFFQLYGFIGPGLRKQEKRWIWPVVLISSFLFWVGVAFAWWSLPAALEFLGSFAQFGVQNLWSLKNYVNLVIFLILAFGVIFQLPLVMGIVIALGLIPSGFFRKHRRYAIIVIFLIAAVATPTTDMMTMVLMAVPLCILYEMSIWVGVLIEKRRAKRKPLVHASE